MEGGFKPGDVVYLKSGSPAMTVSLVTETAVWCYWAHGGEVKEKDIIAATLTRVQPQS